MAVFGCSTGGIRCGLSPARCGAKPWTTWQEVKPLLERHYPTEWCKSQQVYHDRADEDAPPPDPKARKCYLKSGQPGVEATYSIVTVTLALGRQLLAEHGKA